MDNSTGLTLVKLRAPLHPQNPLIKEIIIIEGFDPPHIPSPSPSTESLEPAFSLASPQRLAYMSHVRVVVHASVRLPHLRERCSDVCGSKLCVAVCVWPLVRAWCSCVSLCAYKPALTPSSCRPANKNQAPRHFGGRAKAAGFFKRVPTAVQTGRAGMRVFAFRADARIKRRRECMFRGALVLFTLQWPRRPTWLLGL